MSVKAVASFILSWLFAISCQTKPYTLTTTSPNHTYTVQFVERLNPPGHPYDNHVVGFKVFSDGQQIVDEPRFSAGDDFDQRFGAAHPEHIWITDNLLRLGKRPLATQMQYDEVLIRNNATKAVTYLSINTGSDMFLLFDLQPDVTTKLSIQPQTDQEADMSWIGYGGQFADGKQIKASGLNFKIQGKYHSQGHYCVTIKDNEVIVRSSDFEGISFLYGVERRIPIASNCGE